MALRCNGCGRMLACWLWFAAEHTCDGCRALRAQARNVGLQQYHAAVRRSLADRVITPQEWSALNDLRFRIGVEGGDAFAIHCSVFESACAEILRSNRINKSELDQLEE